MDKKIIFNMINEIENLTCDEAGIYSKLIFLWNKGHNSKHKFWEPIEITRADLLKLIDKSENFTKAILKSLSDKNLIKFYKVNYFQYVIEYVNSNDKVVNVKENKKEYMDNKDIENFTKDIANVEKKQESNVNTINTVEEKWLPFLDYMQDIFAKTYPVHRDISKTMIAARKYIKANKDKSKEEIEEIISKIDAHYLKYCKQKGEFAKGPVKYIENEYWTTKLENSIQKAGSHSSDEYEKKYQGLKFNN